MMQKPFGSFGKFLAAVVGLALLGLMSGRALAEEKQWVVYEGGDGPGKGKQIVFITGDEEYRSEEGLPQLAKILAKHHGFKCTVLFSIDKNGAIDPNTKNNIPGLEALKSADLMIILARFRALPDEQMKYIDDYLKSGKPVIGLRTATHAFNELKGTYAKYNNGATGEWDRGFGGHVLGEQWVNHHGSHGSQSTLGLVAEGAKDHPVLRGIKDGDIWGPTDVYEVRLPMASGITPIIMGEVLSGMKPTDKPVTDKKNNPMMPVAWVKTYKGDEGKEGRVLGTTMGAATDLESEGLRRLIVNGAYWCLGLEDKIPDKADVTLVGEYKPTPFGFNGGKKGVKPADLEMK